MTRGRPGIRPQVSAYLEQHPKGATAGAIAAALGEPHERVQRCLRQWAGTEPRLQRTAIPGQGVVWALSDRTRAAALAAGPRDVPEVMTKLAGLGILMPGALSTRERAKIALGVLPTEEPNPELIPRLAGDALLFAHVDVARVVALREATERIQTRSFAAAFGASAPVSEVLRVANWLLDDIRDGMVPARIRFVPEPKQEESKDA